MNFLFYDSKVEFEGKEVVITTTLTSWEKYSGLPERKYFLKNPNDSERKNKWFAAYKEARVKKENDFFFPSENPAGVTTKIYTRAHM